MKNGLAGLLMLMWTALLCCAPPPVRAQTNDTPAQAQLAADEKKDCIRNLKLIYEAIQAYRGEHKDIPNWLSDLVPQYLNDASGLICPVCKRTGQVESPGLADPKVPCSYLYEFCPVPLGKRDAPANPTKTRREWKRRQMGLAGSVVPIVRCRHHGVVLNLAFDGRIYESGTMWEDVLTNQLDAAELKPARIFAASSPPGAPASHAPAPAAYPPRDPKAKANLIDLSAYYNASLTESWHGNSNNDLSSLPAGMQNFAGVDYDVRGIIQLGGKARAAKRFPARMNGIKIHQKCAQLHFLHSAGFGSLEDEGQQVGSYVLHFAGNQMQLEIPIVYGRDVRNWHKLAGEKPSADLTVAWHGANKLSTETRNDIRLFTTTWVNVAPGVEIESIDFVSNMGTVAPFLIAITCEMDLTAPSVPSVKPAIPLASASPTSAVLARATGPQNSYQDQLWLAGVLASGLAILFLARKLGRRSKFHPASGSSDELTGKTLARISSPRMDQAIVAPLAESQTPAPTWPPALDAGGVSARLPAGVVASLVRWLQLKVVQRLVSDRAQLLATQQAAALQMAAVDERLAKIERQVRQINLEYEQRIDALLMELATAKEENRELIRAKIELVKSEMNKGRLKAGQQPHEPQQS
jgi:hypothetical protein